MTEIEINLREINDDCKKRTVYLRNCKMIVARAKKTFSYETKGYPHWK
jgi:hypothetical protein